MSAQSDHLTEEEVAQVLDLVQEADAIVVGGQSMAIWARLYAGYNPEIAKIYTMSSEDVDFFGIACKDQTQGMLEFIACRRRAVGIVDVIR